MAVIHIRRLSLSTAKNLQNALTVHFILYTAQQRGEFGVTVWDSMKDFRHASIDKLSPPSLSIPMTVRPLSNTVRRFYHENITDIREALP